MKKYFSVFMTILRCRLSVQMAYRLSFWTGSIVDFLFFLTHLMAFAAIFSQVNKVGDWTIAHMAIFIGTFNIQDAIYMTLYFFGLLGLPEQIRSGRLDLYLVKPVRPLFLLSFEKLDMGSLPLLIPGTLMVLWGCRQLDIRLSTGLVVFYLILLAALNILMYCLMVMLRIPAFWWIKTTVFNELEGSLVDFSYRIPGVMLRGFWKFIFYFLLPYGLISTLPTQWLTGELKFTDWLLVGGVVLTFWLLMKAFWKSGLSRYDSASS